MLFLLYRFPGDGTWYTGRFEGDRDGHQIMCLGAERFIGLRPEPRLALLEVLCDADVDPDEQARFEEDDAWHYFELNQGYGSGNRTLPGSVDGQETDLYLSDIKAALTEHFGEINQGGFWVRVHQD